MPAYVIALYKVWDSSWRAKYREPVIELIKKHGGRYVVRADVCPWEMLEGEQPDINGITVIEFPSMEHARAWHRDVEYQPYIKMRQTGANVKMMLADGWDGTFRNIKG
jgi:uncharacterized protein (DUF1330 family)